MSDFEKIQDTLNLEESENQALPSGLNVLTILTFIGSAYGILGGIYSYFTICSSIEKMEMLGDNGLKGTLGDMMQKAIDMAHKQCDNRLAILIITLITCALCIVGAIQMRGRKKSGLVIYAIGELVAPIALLSLMGAGMMAGFQLVGLIIPVIFVALYASQRKHLTK